jgi:hypothetical protein
MSASVATVDERDVGRGSERDPEIDLRLRIGVTGHRCIAEPEAVEAAVASRLQEIRELFADRQGSAASSPLRAIRERFLPRPQARVVFSVLSALAEGADRIVARIALDAELGLGADLGAVLPMAAEDYLEDFGCYESRREFGQLLSLATAQTALHRGPAPRGQARNAAYNRAGRYIVDRSDLLIAVWDGRVAQGHGGTAEVVEYARQQKVPVIVIAARSCDGEDAVAVSELLGAFQAPNFSAAAGDAFACIAHYNVAHGRGSRERHSVESEFARLGRPLEGTSMHWRYRLVADWALPRIVRADRLAIANQRRHTRITWAVQLLAASAVIVVAVQTTFFDHKPIVLVGEIFLVLVLLLAVAVGRRARFHVRWIGYRSMAEEFRSALFLALSAGVEDPLRSRAGVLGEPEEPWYQRAFSQAWRSCPEIALERGDVAALRNLLVEGWLDDQIEYHCRTAGRCRRLQDVYTGIVGVLALATVTVAVLHIAKVGHAAWTEGALRVSALMLPALGGAVVGLREYGQLRLHEERSKRAVKRLRAVRERMLAGYTLASVHRVAVEAHRVMLDETGDWYGVVEFQDVDIVI